MNRIPKLERKLVIYETRRLLGAVAGTALYAVGMNLFVVPHGLYTGGMMGICQVIRTLLIQYAGLPLESFDIAGLIYYIFNIPLFIIAMKKLGKIFFTKTLVCVTAMSFSVYHNSSKDAGDGGYSGVVSDWRYFMWIGDRHFPENGKF